MNIHEGGISQSPEIQSHINKFRPLVEQMKAQAKPYSLQEYLGIVAEEALVSLAEGNYGIASLYRFRKGNQERCVIGRNQLISLRDSSLHAEMDMYNAAESLSRGEKKYLDRLIVRKAPPNYSGKIEIATITSLEECPQCTVRSLTHGTDVMYIGAKDELGGALLDGKDKKLPIIFQLMLKGEIGLQEGETPKPVRIVTPNTTDPDSEDYVDPKFANITWEIFDSTREAIDAQMGRSGLIDMSHFIEITDQLRQTRRG